MTEPRSNPLYFIEINASGSPYEIRLNDCPVLACEAAFNVATKIPVNPWVRNGANVLTVTQRRWKPTSGQCHTEVRVTTLERWPQESDLIASLVVKAPSLPDGWDLPGAPPLHPPLEKKSHLTFRAHWPFPRWSWDLASPRPLLSSDRAAIVDVVRRFWRALSARDLDAVEAILQARNLDLAKARHQSQAERIAEFRITFEDLFDPMAWVLDPLDEEDLEFQPYAHGRLIRVVDRQTGESPLFFTEAAGSLASYLDLFLFRSANGTWLIIR